MAFRRKKKRNGILLIVLSLLRMQIYEYILIEQKHGIFVQLEIIFHFIIEELIKAKIQFTIFSYNVSMGTKFILFSVLLNCYIKNLSLFDLTEQFFNKVYVWCNLFLSERVVSLTVHRGCVL